MRDNLWLYRAIRQALAQGYPRDLSLFQLGFRLLTHFLNEGIKVPVAFYGSI